MIAMALSCNPDILIADEPTTALDVAIQAQVLNLQKEFDLTFLFIAHDLSVVEYFCDRIAVMYLGNIVEMASSKELHDNPLHP
jgi:ABC-type dipeptide/oligopeptide/nickel transport system ATPase component